MQACLISLVLDCGKPELINYCTHFKYGARNVFLTYQGLSLFLPNSSLLTVVSNPLKLEIMKDKQISNQVSTSWIENIALEEIHMEESGVVHFNDHLNPRALLEESSLKFLEELRDRFEFYVAKFNFFRGNTGPGASIKIFKISNTINDFMLFRNSLKLIVALKANGIISIGLLSNSGGLFSPRLNIDSSGTPGAHEIRANIGPFNTITWQFQGEALDQEALVRHYLTEFIKHSAR